MASPQKENGNTGISNELLERVLLFNFPSASPLKIWLFVARKTYGFQKKNDYISLTQFEKGTDLARPTISFWLEWLVKSLLLVKGESSIKGTVYAINKDYEAWVVKPLELVKRKPPTSKPPLTHNKKYNNKKNIRTKVRPMPLKDQLVYEDEVSRVPKKYKGKDKVYRRCVIYYMTLLGKTGNALQFFPAMKDIWELAEKEIPPENIETEVKRRIKLVFDYYKKLKITDWRLQKVAENWNKMIEEEWGEEKQDVSERRKL